MNNFERNDFKSADAKPPHYYGDMVRGLFLVAGIIMLVASPFFKEEIPASLSVVPIIVVVLLAGLTTLRYQWVLMLNVIVSFMGVAVFEYVALYANATGTFFWINQVLAVLFLFSAYYSTKTLRGTYMK